MTLKEQKNAITENLVAMEEIINIPDLFMCVPVGNCPYVTLKRKGIFRDYDADVSGQERGPMTRSIV